MAEVFPIERLFHPLTEPKGGQLVLDRIAKLPAEPLTLSQLNQLLHLSHEAGMAPGFFRFYFLSQPDNHPFRISPPPVDLSDLTSIQSRDQLRWGIDRFALDAAFFFGDFRNAYRELRELDYDDIVEHFAERALTPTASLALRGTTMPLQDIDLADRHLVSELACKALDQPSGQEMSLALDRLISALTDADSEATLADLVRAAVDASADTQLSAALPLVTEDVAETLITSESQLRDVMSGIFDRFSSARERALQNTDLYLSICNELDVYVATSMREQKDFQNTGVSCETILGSPPLQYLNLRCFDPTLSACRSHEDKGLIECLMVDQARVVLHFAGEKDSWGKDAEAAMALSRRKPVIIVCPDTPSGNRRAEIFRDIHPLSRLTDYVHGVAVGAIITNSEDDAIELLRRYFENDMGYSLESKESGFIVKEILTESVVRIVTQDQMIRETFWNYYHGVP